MDAFIFDGVRTPRGRGRQGGALAGVKPVELLQPLFAALVSRNAFDPALVGDIQLGCVTQVGEQGANIAKIAALHAGWPYSVSGVTLNRFCASGLSAIANAAAHVHAGMQDLVVAGGVESMSRVPMLSDRGAWFSDPEVAARTGFIHMGISADLIATMHGFTREQLDTFALRSHQRASAASDSGAFARSLIPVVGDDGHVLLARDERIRPQLTMADLNQREPAFSKMVHGTCAKILQQRYPDQLPLQHLHHSGNSPGIVDGAALVLIGHRRAGEHAGLRPRARIRGFATASVEPVVMLTGPALATQKALKQAGVELAEVDRFEINESFAAPVLACQQALGIAAERVNVHGGAIAMGHPLGATGAVLTQILLDGMEAAGERFGVVAMCAGAGLAVALVIERVSG